MTAPFGVNLNLIEKLSIYRAPQDMMVSNPHSSLILMSSLSHSSIHYHEVHYGDAFRVHSFCVLHDSGVPDVKLGPTI